MIKGTQVLTRAVVSTLQHMAYDTFVLRPIPGVLGGFLGQFPCENFDVAFDVEALLYDKDDRLLHTVACATSKIPPKIGAYVERSILGVDSIPGLWHSNTVRYLDLLSVAQWRELTRKSTETETN